jgi:hypothetical protein
MISWLFRCDDMESGSVALLLVAMHLFHMQVACLARLTALLGGKLSEARKRRLLPSPRMDPTARQKSFRRFRFRKQNLAAVFEASCVDTGTTSQSSSDSTNRAAPPCRTPSFVDDDSSCGSLGPYHPGIHAPPSSSTGFGREMEDEPASTSSSRRTERAYSRFYRNASLSFLGRKKDSVGTRGKSSSIKS